MCEVIERILKNLTKIGIEKISKTMRKHQRRSNTTETHTKASESTKNPQKESKNIKKHQATASYF